MRYDKTHHKKNPDSRKKLAIFFFLLPLPLCSLYAQIQVTGIVKSKDPDREGIHVINKTSNTATITDNKGHFSIPATPGDTLLFSAVQFRDREIVIAEANLNGSALIVDLEEQVTELDEVILKNLTGNLDSDLRDAKTDTVNAMSLGLPNTHVIPRTQAERKLYTSTDKSIVIDKTSISPNIGLKTDFIINGITGRTKKLKNRLKQERKKAKLEKVRKSFGDRFFLSAGIAREKIYDFLYFCSVQQEYNRIIKTDDQAALLQFLKVQATRYTAINNPVTIPKD
ncbi:carboxypeptidase-like regulatory domain-containing protein [Sinomicrobium kalidii]|uniref:carboxypeptidase-like regulatory domain-containing protein n=1 Tax=Sinomicrobium kalidii TaxID=2900738 RepID=UPI001E351F44|nr:carboxypeptidase-like regulatory domain-containing protein [Sinomicrobium kalidii]UGU15971.1 carboxypeptidase-like regulatory domain-containing protein [Sinomicrobium kalidii]